MMQHRKIAPVLPNGKKKTDSENANWSIAKDNVYAREATSCVLKMS